MSFWAFDLAKLPFEVPGLPPDFADGFFRSESRQSEGDETAANVRASTGELELELAQRRELRAKLEAEEAAAAKMESERAAKVEALGQLEAQLAELQTRAAELRAQVGNK